MPTLPLLYQFAAVSALMQIKLIVPHIHCLNTDAPDTTARDTWDHLCLQLDDVQNWLSTRFERLDDSDSLPESVQAQIRSAIAQITDVVTLPWSDNGLDFSRNALQQCLQQLPTPWPCFYIHGTAVYKDTLQGATFGSLYGDAGVYMTTSPTLEEPDSRFTTELLELSSFIAADLVGLALNNSSYVADDWHVVTVDATDTRVQISTAASYCA